MKLMTGLTMATIGPKKAFVTRMESAPVSGAVIRNDMHDDREAPFLRISATTGTTEQLQSGIGTPTAAAMVTDLRLSCLSQRRTACREMNTWMSPERNNPSSSIGASSRNDCHRKSKNAAAASSRRFVSVVPPVIGLSLYPCCSWDLSRKSRQSGPCPSVCQTSQMLQSAAATAGSGAGSGPSPPDARCHRADATPLRPVRQRARLSALACIIAK